MKKLFVLLCLIGIMLSIHKLFISAVDLKPLYEKTEDVVVEHFDGLPDMPKDRKDYVKRFASTAVAEMEKFGVPASISLAQGILESADGASMLAKDYNNHFGIKFRSVAKVPVGLHKFLINPIGHHDDCKKHHIKTKHDGTKKKLIKKGYIPCGDYTYCLGLDQFCAYDRVWASWRHHSYVVTKPRYKPHGSNPGYKEWAKALQRGGYATNPLYADLLIELIERYGLHRFDSLANK